MGQWTVRVRLLNGNLYEVEVSHQDEAQALAQEIVEVINPGGQG